MDFGAFVGLLVQLAAILVLVGAFGWGCLRRTGFYFVVIAFAYHGIAELGIAVTGRRPPLRPAELEQMVGDWTVLVGASMLTFSLVYIALSDKASELQSVESRRRAVLAALPWPPMAGASVFLVGVVAAGGYRGGASASYGEGIGGTQSGLTEQFLTPALALTMIGFIASGSNRRMVPTLFGGTLVVSLVGSRLTAVVLIGLTLFGLMLLDRRPTRRHVGVALCLVAALAFVVDQARQHSGRSAFTQATSATDRLGQLAGGTLSWVKGDEARFADAATQPWAERLDGNTFGALVLAELRAGEPPVGAATVVNDTLLAVPSALNPAKLSSDITERSEKLYLRQWFVLDLPLDFLPTQLGVMLAYLGPWGLPLLAGGLGVLYAWGDRLIGRGSLLGFLVPLALLSCAMSYERSMETYVLTARGFAVIFVGAALLAAMRRPTASVPVR